MNIKPKIIRKVVNIIKETEIPSTANTYFRLMVNYNQDKYLLEMVMKNLLSIIKINLL